MKLSKSKLALAKVINENGGWPDSGSYAAQVGNGAVWTSQSKPIWIVGGFRFSMDYCCYIATCELINNRHQAILSREEYYQAYPKAGADGWIEWKGGECPVDSHVDVDYRMANDATDEFHHESADELRWSKIGSSGDIIAYRLRKPEVKPEFCESVMRSIPEPEEKFSESDSLPLINQCRRKMVDVKPTIEQLAADYRNAKDYAERKQQEADKAEKVACAKLFELECAIEDIGFAIKAIDNENTASIAVDDWRNFKVGDFVSWSMVSDRGEFKIISVHHDEAREIGDFEIKGEKGGVFRCYGNEITFIRRP